jgi:hypothetical protein
MSYNVSYSFSKLVSFLTIFQVLQCAFLIFQVFQCFSPYSRSYNVCVSFSPFFSFPTVCIFHISRFSMFLTLFQYLQCVFLTLHFFQCFLPYFMSYHVSFSFSLFVSFLTKMQVLMCVCLILHVFSVFLAIFQVIQCLCPFPCLSVFSPQSRSYRVYYSYFTFITVSRHIPGPTVCVSHFKCFFSFLTIIQVLWSIFTILHVFQCFSQYSRSYNICVSFSTFFSFLTTIQILQCVFFIFHVYHCFSPYSRS